LKIVVLTSRFPYPIEKGDKLRIYHQLKFLSKTHEVHLLSISHDKVSVDHIKHLEEICTSVRVLDILRSKSFFSAALGIFNKLPFQVNFFYSQKIKVQIDNHVEELNPDVIYCQLVRMSEYIKDLSYPKVLDYMDAFSLNYARRTKHESFLVKYFFEKECRRLKKYEDEIYNEVDDAVIISKNDGHHIGSKKDISVISNGLDTTVFQPFDKPKVADIVFVGNMGYHPNILAAKFLVHEVKPLLKSDLSIQIAGARPSSAVKALESEKVKVTGWMDDIRDAYASSKLFVAPIFSGAGQQNKILEAMAMELICITTSIVNESIQAEVGKEVLIANSATEFAEQIEKVVKNIDAYENIGANARKFVEAKFSWDNENAKLEKVLIKVSKRKKE